MHIQPYRYVRYAADAVVCVAVRRFVCQESSSSDTTARQYTSETLCSQGFANARRRRPLRLRSRAVERGRTRWSASARFSSRRCTRCRPSVAGFRAFSPRLSRASAQRKETARTQATPPSAMPAAMPSEMPIANAKSLPRAHWQSLPSARLPPLSVWTLSDERRYGLAQSQHASVLCSAVTIGAAFSPSNTS
jgi:hypothetical protein